MSQEGEHVVFLVQNLSGHPPSPRYSHSAVLIGDNMYIFGGSDGDVYFNEMHILDVNAMGWTHVDPMGVVPSGREKHVAVAFERTILVFGGRTDFGLSNELYCFHIDTKVWSKPEVTGQVPSPRRGHTAAIVGETIYVLGGETNSGVSNELFALNPRTFHWTEVHPSGRAPEGRFLHSSTVLAGNMILFFGGLMANKTSSNDILLLDTETNSWSRPRVQGQPPEPRGGHTASLVGSKVVFFGGCGKEGSFNDLHLLDLERMAWWSPELRGVSVGRDCHSSLIVADEVFLFGGRDNVYGLNELLVLSTPALFRLLRASVKKDEQRTYAHRTTPERSSPQMTRAETFREQQGRDSNTYLNEKLRTLETELTKAIADKEKELAAVKMQKDILQKEVDQVESRMVNLKVDNDLMRSKVRDLEEELLQLKVRGGDVSRPAVEEVPPSHSEDVARLKGEIVDLRRQNRALEEEVEQANKDLEDLIATQKKTEEAKATAMDEAIQAEISALKAKNKQLEEEIVKVKVDKVQAVAQERAEKNVMAKKVETLEAQLREKSAEMESKGGEEEKEEKKEEVL